MTPQFRFYYEKEMRLCSGRPMKHPVRSDFATVVTETGVSVTFKPTNSIYTFYRPTVGEDVARLGPVAFTGVQHAGRIASELGKSLWSIQLEKTANKQTLGRYQIGGDDDVIE